MLHSGWHYSNFSINSMLRLSQYNIPPHSICIIHIHIRIFPDFSIAIGQPHILSVAITGASLEAISKVGLIHCKSLWFTLTNKSHFSCKEGMSYVLLQGV